MIANYTLIIIQGAFFTLILGICSLFLALCLGLFFAYLKLSSNKTLNRLATLYTTLIRGVPDLVMMLLVFYGLQILLNVITDEITSVLLFFFEDSLSEDFSIFININPFFAGTFALGFIFGAYMAETFRGAILTIENGQLEAANAFAMPRLLKFRRIVFPQIVFYGLSSFTNNWLILLKATSLVSVIGLNDMVRQANFAAASTKQPFFFYIIISIIFLMFTSLSLWLLNKLKQRYHFINA